MVMPAFSSLIICSTVKPACSPAIASLPTLLANDGLSVMLTPVLNVLERASEIDFSGCAARERVYACLPKKDSPVSPLV